MHASLRRLQCAPGQAREVARLIEDEYVPKLEEVPGTVSYTLVQAGDDVVTSLGVFATAEGAERANALAREWAGQRLADLGTAPLEAGDGEVLVHAVFLS
jgi:hypothetical protein